MFSRTCAAVLPPGIAQVTASFIRIQRSASRVERRARGYQRAEFLDGLQPHVERHA